MTPERRKSDKPDVVSILFGVLFVVAGGVAIYYELRSEPHNTVIVGIGFGSAVFGALLISPDIITDRLRRLAGAVRGLRKSDG